MRRCTSPVESIHATCIRRQLHSTSCPDQGFGRRKASRLSRSKPATVCLYRRGQFTRIGIPARPIAFASLNLSLRKRRRDEPSPCRGKTESVMRHSRQLRNAVGMSAFPPTADLLLRSFRILIGGSVPISNIGALVTRSHFEGDKSHC